MAQYNHQLKRLQHPINSFGYRSPLANNEAMRESIRNFSIPSYNHNKFSRPVFIIDYENKNVYIKYFSLHQLLIKHDVVEVQEEFLIVIGLHQYHYQDVQLIMI